MDTHKINTSRKLLKSSLLFIIITRSAYGALDKITCHDGTEIYDFEVCVKCHFCAVTLINKFYTILICDMA